VHGCLVNSDSRDHSSLLYKVHCLVRKHSMGIAAFVAFMLPSCGLLC
ncbi:unnamed protein product, partial [Musa acuminata var. zebrina]